VLPANQDRAGARLVLRLRFDLVEGGEAPADLGDDVLGAGFPDEWFRILVPVLGPGGDRGGELGDAGEHAAAQAFVGQFFEPPFDQIDPGTGGGSEMQMPAATVPMSQPLLDLRGGVGGQVVQHHMNAQATGTAVSLCLKNLSTSAPV